MRDRPTIDMTARGSVVGHVLTRQQAGLVRDCIHLRLERRNPFFFPKCHLDWASEEPDPGVEARAASDYRDYAVSWPKCPTDCPRYSQSDNFHLTAGRDQYEYKAETRLPKAIVVPPPPPVAIALAPPVPTPLKVPDKVTLRWLYENVTAGGWLAFAGFLATVFLVGAKSARYDWVRELLVIEIPAPPLKSPEPLPPAKTP